MTKRKTHNWAEIEKYILDGHTKTEAAIKFGFAPYSLEKARKDGKLNLPSELLRKNCGPNFKPLSTFLAKDTAVSSTYLKKRLVNDGILEYKCAKCSLSEWLGNKIVLQLDHINGDHYDNRIHNLRLLCPNCHSQTVTFNVGNNKMSVQKILNAIKDKRLEPQEARAILFD